VARFVLPLVEGGALHVGRPLSSRHVGRHLGAGRLRASGDAEALVRLAAVRAERGRRLLPTFGTPAFDEVSFRLGACVHDLLCLGHPAFAARPAAQMRIAMAAEQLATVPPPASSHEVIERHTFLERLPEVLVPYVAGAPSPPPRQPEDVRPTVIDDSVGLAAGAMGDAPHRSRPWLATVGVARSGRGAYEALLRASPLGEALSPLRIDPTWSWRRVLPILRFAPIARLVAGRLHLLGSSQAGGALVRALIAFAAERAADGGRDQRARDLAFSIRFLSHLAWLDVVAPRTEEAPSSGAGVHRALTSAEGAYEAFLRIALSIDIRLVKPPDVPEESDLAQRLLARLRRGAPSGLGDTTAEAVCRHAAESLPGQPTR
jgi:hypothetical protein